MAVRWPWLPSVSRSPSGVSSVQAAEVDAEPAADVGQQRFDVQAVLQLRRLARRPRPRCRPPRSACPGGTSRRPAGGRRPRPVRARPRCTSRPRPGSGARMKVASALAAQNCWPRPELPAWNSTGVRCGEGADRCGPSMEYAVAAVVDLVDLRPGRRGRRFPCPGAARRPPTTLPTACRRPRRIRPPSRSVRHAWSARWRRSSGARSPARW